MDKRPIALSADDVRVEDDPLDVWYRAYHRELEILAVAETGSVSDARDLVQDAYHDLCRRLEADGVEGIRNPRAWLYRVLRHHIRDWRRAHDVQQRHADNVRRGIHDVPQVDQAVEASYVTQLTATTLMETLPPREHGAVARWSDNESLDAIAQAVGLRGRRRAHEFIQRILRTLRKRVSDA